MVIVRQFPPVPSTQSPVSSARSLVSSPLRSSQQLSTPSQTSSTSSSSSAQTLATGKAPNPVLYDFKKHDGEYWVTLYLDPEGTKKSYPVYWDYLRALFPKQDLNSKEICDNIIGSRTIVKWAKDITWNKYKQEFRLPEDGIHDGEILSPYNSCMKDFMAFFKKTKIVFDAPLTRINIRNSRKRKQRDKTPTIAGGHSRAQKTPRRRSARTLDQPGSSTPQPDGPRTTPAVNTLATFTSFAALMWLRVKGRDADGLSEFVVDTFDKFTGSGTPSL